MRRKKVTITRCQDCPYVDCEERTLCGLIPEGCWLDDAEEQGVSEADNAGGDDAEG